MTHVVLLEVGVVLLDPVVQDGDHHALPREALLPRPLGVEVTVVAVILWRKEEGRDW